MSPLRRCAWATNDLAIFAFLVLEGAQAGLSWDTILRKRDRYRTASGMPNSVDTSLEGVAEASA
ncbi:MAG: DNA-3-methyladenine glycosylase I, partial [Thermomicrobia bacterium]|nr:DNA-3-methyladenine glycosylase I [Thermomicrobia bacterium]MCA1725905.1 DNA-3-methyladenine glycosylase I [Thermomicrobia bacterium]